VHLTKQADTTLVLRRSFFVLWSQDHAICRLGPVLFQRFLALRAWLPGAGGERERGYGKTYKLALGATQTANRVAQEEYIPQIVLAKT
jgi:hypothetical protein